MEALSSDGGPEQSFQEEAFKNVEDFMSFDSGTQFCSSLTTTSKILSSYASSPLQSTSSSYVPFDAMDFASLDSDILGSPSSVGDKVRSGQLNIFVGFSTDSNDGNYHSDKRDHESFLQNMSLTRNHIIPRLLAETLSDKMLRVLSLFKESSGCGILAQVWVPIRHNDEYILSTYEQPYMLDMVLASYRAASKLYTFSAEVKAGSSPELPGRVFISGVPEWTSNVLYYDRVEYSRMQLAIDHEVCGTIALPVFGEDNLQNSCCAVLELVTVEEKSNFDSEIQNVCRALEAVNLWSAAPSNFNQLCFSGNKRDVFAEISDLLQAVCCENSLPLALTWIPCTYTKGLYDENLELHVKGGNKSSKDKLVLCVEDTACYVRDREMQGFIHACGSHFLEEGQGVAGKVLNSNLPFFSPDVKEYHINEHPHVHHARKFGLNAAVSIRLRSTYTADDDYILEFFLPVHLKGRMEQKSLLNDLSSTMQRMFRSLRTISDTELVGAGGTGRSHQESIPILSSTTDLRRTPEQELHSNADSVDQMDLCGVITLGPGQDTPPEQMIDQKGQSSRKRIAVEKDVSSSVLQQYFSGSLKDAAKSIGVCPSTLKRICRRHGIARWPSRKIKKVNRSLRKLQTELDSVQGVEGGLKFDAVSGSVVAESSVIQSFNSVPVNYSENSSPGSDIMKQGSGSWDIDKMPEKSDPLFASGISRSIALTEEVHTDEYFMEPNQSAFSDLSNPSTLTMRGISSSCPHPGVPNSEERQPGFGGNGPIIIAKASYKEDKIRFKFEPSNGCLKLYEEVEKRLRIQRETFRLKYLDDEEEWVMLVSDSDLQECLEILDSVGTRRAKFLVCDIPCVTASSGSSSCIITGSS